MKIEIWSDFVCPFCYIGKRSLESALAVFPYKDVVTVEYKSYQLDPTSEHILGKSFSETFSELKGIPMEQVQQMNKQVGEQAREIGLNYYFDQMKYTNTLDAHRIAQYAITQGKGAEITERLLYAYFTESELLSDHETLIKLASEIGLDPSEVKAVLQSNKYRKKVDEDIEIAQQIGVQGVPFFVFNEKYGLSGAQSSEVFTEVLEKVWKEEQNQPVFQTSGQAKTTYCTGEDCEEN